MNMNLNNVASRLRDQVLTHGGLTVETRKQRLRKLSNCIQQNETSINEALRLDLGKSLFETYATEVGFILSEIQHVLKHLDKWARPKKVRTPLTLMPGQSFIHPEPYGVVLILS